MAELDELARIQQAHHRRLLGVQDGTAELVGQAWDTYAGFDDVAAAQFEAAADVLITTAKQQTSTLAVAYMNANDRLAGFTPAGLVPVVPEIRNGIPTTEVYHRSIVEARRRVAGGMDPVEALAAGRSRAVSTARTDVILANKAEIARGGEIRPHVVGYRRVLTGKSCAFCATASTQRYRSADLMPIHPSCDCDVGEIIGRDDPGQVINRDLLDQLKGTADGGRPDYWNGPYLVDEDGTVRLREVKTITGPDGKPLLGPNGAPLRKVEAGRPLRVETVEHGELGPTLTDACHATTAADEIPATRPSSPANVEKPRSRAKATDPDVISEANRRGVSPDRVVELREEAAQRRYLEDRARREAAKDLTVDHPDVKKVAEKYGIEPDEVLSARARVADVRKVAREEAARVQADALRELDRLDSIKLRNPPRIGSKTGTGTSARRGEWDWLEQIDERERARLSRQWYGGTQAPDQFAFNMSNALGRDLSTDEAMDLWLDLNRRAEGAGALRRGKIPSGRAYSDALDLDRLLPELHDEGYDVVKLFGDDLDAAGHVASVERDLVRREALDYLGEAASPVEGPSPYRLSFQSWEEEVRDLEYELREGTATARQRRRYAELVPQYLDEPGLDFEDLYARIVTTARKAGEEVPDYARIPW